MKFAVTLFFPLIVLWLFFYQSTGYSLSRRYINMNAKAYWKNVPEGFIRFTDEPLKSPPKPIPVTSTHELKELISTGYRVPDLDVRGDIASVLHSTDQVHAVVKLLHDRKNNNCKNPVDRKDKFKVALSIEGGGMRGCVAAGMVSAIWHLGLQDSIDVVYGSSAGSLVGAYFITGQLPHEGPEIYYDVLTSAGKRFIDSKAIFRSIGLGVLDFRIESLLSLLFDRMGKPVLNLNYLFDTIVGNIKPLDWEKFWGKQVSGKLPLKVVASGLISKKPVIMSAENNNFVNLNELSTCMKASMLLPGITGDAIRLKGSQLGPNIIKTSFPEYKSRLDKEEVVAGEPMSDALIYEPVPYRSAIREGATHIIALRTRADNISVTAKMSTFEKMIMSRFFGRKLKIPELVYWMQNQYHKLIYAEDVLRLNEANRDFSDSLEYPRLYGIAMPAGVTEVSRTETNREIIFNNVKQGFAAAYDSLVLDPKERGNGMKIADQIWPKEILSTPPKVSLLQLE